MTEQQQLLIKGLGGNSLEVRWLGLCAFTAGTWVWSLVRELRSHKIHGMAKRTNKKEWRLVLPIGVDSYTNSDIHHSLVSDGESGNHLQIASLNCFGK